MADNNPFLFIHLPLDEIRGEHVLDATPHRRHAVAHNAQIVPDETFGACVELTGARTSHMVCPPWKLNPAVFLSPASGADPLKLTFTIWISPAAGDGEWNVIDAGFRRDIQRLKVQLKRTNQTLSFTVLAPAENERSRGYRWTAEVTAPADPWLHFALIWDPYGEGTNQGYGNCQMFLNGGLFSSFSRTVGEPRASLSGAASMQTVLGAPSFHGRLAHFRIYTRALTQTEIEQDIDRDLERLRIESALDCSFLDPNGNPMMHLDVSSDGEKMQLVVKPRQGGMALDRLPRAPVTPEGFHFELAFRPGTLDPSGNRQIPVEHGRWDAKLFSQIAPDGRDSICIWSNPPEPLPQDGVRVTLETLKADRRFGPRSTPVDIRYRHVTDSRGQVVSGRVRQWLQLVTHHAWTSPRAPALTLTEGWTAESPHWGIVPGGGGHKIRLYGHVVSVDSPPKMEAQWDVLTTLPPKWAPFADKEMRFPGRVRWLSQAGSSEPKTLWCGDVSIQPTGVVSITGNAPPEMRGALGRIEVFLDDVSYSDEKLWVES